MITEPLSNQFADTPESNPDSRPTLTEQIAATQAEVDAIGEVISVAMGLMAAKIDLLERLQEMAKLGPFYEFIAGMEGR